MCVRGDDRRLERRPYATPPVGELRFRRPQPATHRDESLETTTRGPSPMQPAQPETNGGVSDNGVTDEDCLTLNIVRPAGDATDLPVMVWIYGSAFTVGASRNYDGRHLAARGDVVVVAVNYRVDPGVPRPGLAVHAGAHLRVEHRTPPPALRTAVGAGRYRGLRR